jgi:hypothetical protein
VIPAGRDQEKVFNAPSSLGDGQSPRSPSPAKTQPFTWRLAHTLDLAPKHVNLKHPFEKPSFFDHEKLVAYQRSIDLVACSFCT